MSGEENGESSENLSSDDDPFEIGDDLKEQLEPQTEPPQSSDHRQANQRPDLESVLNNLEGITALVREWFEQSRENKRVANEGRQLFLKHRERIVYTAAVAFLGVVIVSAFMTWQNALSGDAFTFVLGTLFGSILTFLQTMLGGSQSDE